MSKKKATPQETVTAYKGFDKNLQCRDYPFEIGKTFDHDGPVEACASCFHSCEYPLDVFIYYPPAESRYALVKASGSISRDGGDSKIASASLSIEVELHIPEMVSRAVDWVLARIDQTIEQASTNTGDYSAATNTGTRSAATNTGDYSAAINTGTRSAATNTGYQSAATNTGTRSAATNTGYQSAATNTGYQSAATNTGDYSAAINTGTRSAATNTGYQSAATNTGYQSAATNTGTRSAATNTGTRSAATNTGYQSAATNTGYQSAATNTGDYSAAINTGYQSAATNTGYQSASEVNGNQSVAASFGDEGRARASEGGAIVLCHRGDGGGIVHIRASKVGENGVLPDTWYTLNAAGEFVAVDQ